MTELIDSSVSSLDLDTNIIASNISGSGSGSIISGGNTNIFNGVDTTFSYSNSTKTTTGIIRQMPGYSQYISVISTLYSPYLSLANGLTGGNLNKIETASGTNYSKNNIAGGSTTQNLVSSNLNFGSNLTIGSNLNSNGDLNLVSKDEINITSALNSSYQYSDFHKKGSSSKRSSSDKTIDITNVSSNLAANGNINISSGSNTNITASNLSGTDGNIIVGKYTDPNTLTDIINSNATLTIKSGQDYHYKYHEETKIKTDQSAMVVGAVAAAAVVVAAVLLAPETGGTSAALISAAPEIGAAAAGGAATGSGARRGRTLADEQIQIVQKISTLNFTGNLNTQSASDTTITASTLTANNATILTGKLRDQNTGIDTITNTNAKLNINSALNTTDTKTSTEKVKPNYVGIAVVAGGGAYVGSLTKNFLTSPISDLGPALPIISNSTYNLIGGAYLGSQSKNINPNQNKKSLMDPLFNIRNSSSSSSHQEIEIKTNLNFNNLITE